MLRAARFEQRFHFRIESRTLELIKEASDLLKQVSGDRIRHEFNLIFQEEDPAAVFRRLEELNLLESIVPGMHWGKDQTSDWNNLIQSDLKQVRSSASKNVQAEFYWLVLFHHFDPNRLEAACLRLKLPTGIAAVLESAVRLQSRLPDLTNLPVAEAVRFMENLPEVSLQAVKAFYPGSEGSTIIQKYLETWKNVKTTVNGRHLEKMGVPHGPVYRTILEALRAAWLTGEITSKAEEAALLKELIIRYE
jgi:tRNA nucleotidyltransferase (CCA-adding enzyme)